MTSFRTSGAYGTNAGGERPSAIVFLIPRQNDGNRHSVVTSYVWTDTSGIAPGHASGLGHGYIRGGEYDRGYAEHARTLLKRSFERTHTNRQSQLISKVLRSPLNQVARQIA